MKQRLFLILTILFFFSCITAKAQRPSQDDMKDVYRAEKVAFITTEINLTPAEAEKFWPVYNEFDNKRWEVQKARGTLEMKVRDNRNTLSEKEIIQLTRDYAKSMKEEGEINITYNEKFLKILPPQKVLALYKAERDFRSHMYDMIRGGNRNNNNR